MEEEVEEGAVALTLREAEEAGEVEEEGEEEEEETFPMVVSSLSKRPILRKMRYQQRRLTLRSNRSMMTGRQLLKLRKRPLHKTIITV